jgi:hypothetical protein
MYRRSSIFWGVLFILLAALLLLRQAGLITGDIFGYFWPLLIIAFGLWLILGFFGRHQAIQGEQVSVPLEGAKSAYLRFNHGAGRLNLKSGAAAGEILNGTFGEGLDYKSQLSGDRLEVKLRTPAQFWAWWPGGSLDWDVHLNREVVLNLKIDTGASASVLDLSDLNVVDLDIDSGASSTEVTLPAAAGSTHVDIDTGASSLKIHVPSGVAASIRIKSGIASVNVASGRFPRVDGGLYQSADYPTAANRADITIDAGVGSIEVD